MSDKPDQRVPETPLCPICRNPADPEASSYPFCSERCRLVDLGQWFSGRYIVGRPIEQSDLEEGD